VLSPIHDPVLCTGTVTVIYRTMIYILSVRGCVYPPVYDHDFVYIGGSQLGGANAQVEALTPQGASEV